jgi:hypothetical protein
MIDLFRAGGFMMWAILLLGLAALAFGAVFAFRPDRRLLPSIGLLSASLLCSIFAGICADFAAVGSQIPSRPEWANSPKVHLIILEGFGESMSPGILGFSLLALVALECAVGVRKLAYDT